MSIQSMGKKEGQQRSAVAQAFDFKRESIQGLESA
jgi:hypothetical protein